ncbi:hypothetical protein [Microbacterium azadirachtae]|uniref:hypothetical protein n=1 Tax=Microbacterium azadirachtae TaxID=582680 RepID=UPI000697A46A|nr:hypothetical protein [Microbacterium azadirachtae]
MALFFFGVAVNPLLSGSDVGYLDEPLEQGLGGAGEVRGRGWFGESAVGGAGQRADDLSLELDSRTRW